jgi:hypothetical protein
MGGHAITQFVSSSGEIEQKALESYESQDKAYSAYPADLRSKEDASHGYILVGNKRINVEVANDLGGLSILHINPDGSFFVEVAELVFNTAIRVDQRVYHYDSSGNLVGMARVPLAEQYTYVAHGIAAGPDGKIYALITKPGGGEIQRLTFSVNLPPILMLSLARKETEQPKTLSYVPESCISRESIIKVASDYMNNSTYLNSYHIDDNSACAPSVTIIVRQLRPII